MRRPLGLAGVVAAAFLLLHLPFLPSSLEDLDSINFALGVRQFDVANHQPHPPGYPVYIAAAKVVNAIVSNEAHALALLAIVTGALSVLALASLFRYLDRDERSRRLVLPATILTTTAPLYWFTAARPMSDVPGLAAAIGVQAFTLAANTGDRLAVAAFLAGLASGIRSQVVWLTVPLLVLVAARRPRQYRLEDALVALGTFTIGALLWFVPLLWLTGGPMGYWRVISAQRTSDLGGDIVWSQHTIQQLRFVATSTFVAPWAMPVLSGLVLLLALAGFVALLKSSRPVLVLLAVAFGPYLVFDLLFQDTLTTRYALPLVVPMAYLAVRGVAVLPERAGTVVVSLLSAAGLVIGAVNVQAFAHEEAPAFRLMADMRAGMPKLGGPPVLAMHVREDLDLRRPFVWLSGTMPSWTDRLPSTPKHEWLEVTKYLRSDSRAPVWFVADPLRSDLALIDHQDPHARYRWPLSQPILLGGTRPSEMDWYVFDRPSWFLGEGWALTLETAGMSDTSTRGRGRAPSQGWVRHRNEPVTFLVGGRNFAGDGASAVVSMSFEGRVIDERSVAPGFFMYLVTADVKGPDGYGELDVATRGDVAIEQFDVQGPDRVVFGYGPGWQEREYEPSTGRLWRWMSERGELRVRGVAGQPTFLAIDGVTETFSRASHVVVRVGDRVIAREEAGKTFSIRVEIPADLLAAGSEQTVTVETDQVYVPAEHSTKTQDRRHLGLKVFDCRFTDR